jgi:dCMP deaminase
MISDKWDHRFLALARHVAGWSKDPSTQTGAVIVNSNRQIVSLGFNGLPRGLADTPERLHNRDLKYKLIVHCERNAILFAGRELRGTTLYTWPLASCSVCAAMVIQVGIARCVAPPVPAYLQERWGVDLALTREMFAEAGVQLDLIGTIE